MTQSSVSVTLANRIGRGESLYVWSAVAFTALVLIVLGVGGLLLAPIQRQAASASLQRELERTARMFAPIIAPMIEQGQTGEVRTLLTAAAQDGGFTSLRVMTGEGKVITQSLAGPVDEAENREQLSAVATFLLAEHGQVHLEVVSPAAAGIWIRWELQAVLGVAAALGLGGLALALGRLRVRIRGWRAVGDALISMMKGEETTAALAVDSRFGEEAVAWNNLLENREQLRQDLAKERARDSLHNRNDGRGDLAQACDALWQGMLVVDETLSVKYANGAAAVFLRSKKEAMNAPGAVPVTQFVSDEQVLEAIRSVASGELRRRTTHEVRRTEAEGGGILRFSVRPVRRDDAAAALIIIEDITQQRVADEARNAFVAQVTHELRTPLTNIRLYVEQAIEEGESDPASVAQALNVINQESRRLERIVGDMLSVSEIEAGSFKLRTAEVRLDALFEELEADYRPQAEAKKLGLVFELPPKLPAIRGDRDKIVMALHNLIGNAIKYTPEGGNVCVRVDVENSRLNVDVKDSGIGISPDETDLIFDKFYRAKDKRVSGITGTGLGLALAREVVRLHGGDISVRSQVDRGSTFTLNLPTLGEAA